MNDCCVLFDNLHTVCMFHHVMKACKKYANSKQHEVKDRSSLASETGILMKYVLQNFILINAYFAGNHLMIQYQNQFSSKGCVSQFVVATRSKIIMNCCSEDTGLKKATNTVCSIICFVTQSSKRQTSQQKADTARKEV